MAGRREVGIRAEVAGPAMLAAALVASAVALFILNLSLVPAGLLAETVKVYGIAPRFAVGLLCGGTLGLAGALFQQVLRNPLAEPGTLGVFAGAQLALTAAALWLPALAQFGSAAVAFCGSILAAALVFGMSARRGFTPIAVILAGMIASIYLSAANAMLSLFNHQVLEDLYIWQAGSLVQNDWRGAAMASASLVLAGLVSGFLVRPLGLLELGDEGARGLGVRLAAIRSTSLGLAIAMTATVASVAGPIGFIGLLSPMLARAAGARRAGARIFWSAAIGSGLLACADQSLALIRPIADVPTGAVVAAIGAPASLLLLRRMRPVEAAFVAGVPRQFEASPRTVIAALLVALTVTVFVGLSLGRTPDGWFWSLGEYLPWRGARVAVSAAAGILLAYAGVLLQRLTGNAMASPELLGVSSGAALGLVGVALLATELDRLTVAAGAIAGAGTAICALFTLGRRSAYAPEHMVLAGVMLTALLGAVSSVILASGDPRAGMLLQWLAGSTYRATFDDAVWASTMAGIALVTVPLLARPLTILPLGAGFTQSLGMSVPIARVLLLALASLATAIATLVVGPLSFVGILAPHAARMIGLTTARLHLIGAMMIGVALMVFADWIGRMAAYPWQIPAGLMGSLLGGVFVTLVLGRRRFG